MLYALCAMVVIMLLLYFMPIVVRIDVNKDNDNDKITIGIRTLYGLLKLKSEIPFLKIVFENGRPALKYKLEVADKKRSRLMASITKVFSLGEGEGVYRLLKKYRKPILIIGRYMARKTRINQFNFKLSFGTGDAAATGILYGVTWIIAGNIMTFANSLLNVRNPRIQVIPLFSSVQLSVDFDCIIHLQLGHIINAGIRAIPALKSSIKK